MAERPIIMSAPMVQAILAGRKSHTRRVIKPQPELNWKDVRPEPRGNCRWVWMVRTDFPEYSFATNDRKIHYQPGDLLWVRETFWHARRYPGSLPSGESYGGAWACTNIHYAADGNPPNTPNRHYPNGLKGGYFSAPDPYAMWFKRPSIHMPKRFARLWLRVTAVRVERVQDISCANAIAEGIPAAATYETIDCETPDPRHEYRQLWDSLNARRGFGWDTNPWVAVVEFERVEKTNG